MAIPSIIEPACVALNVVCIDAENNAHAHSVGAVRAVLDVLLAYKGCSATPTSAPVVQWALEAIKVLATNAKNNELLSLPHSPRCTGIDIVLDCMAQYVTAARLSKPSACVRTTAAARHRVSHAH